MTTRIRALSVSRSLRPFLRRPHTGVVPATFARSCYLDLDGRILVLVAPELRNGPLHIVVALSTGFTFAQLPAGTRMQSSPQRLMFDNGIQVALTAATAWNPRLRALPGRERSRMAPHLDAIRSVLAAAPLESLARDDRRPPRASAAIAELTAAVRARDAARVAGAAGRLSGLGPGLTPSGDDLLAGTLIALAALRPRGAAALRDAIRDEAVGRTARISAAYLDAAARGEAGEAWHQLIRALADAESDGVVRAARQVMAFGETSGADMLAGFSLAMDALTS